MFRKSLVAMTVFVAMTCFVTAKTWKKVGGNPIVNNPPTKAEVYKAAYERDKDAVLKVHRIIAVTDKVYSSDKPLSSVPYTVYGNAKGRMLRDPKSGREILICNDASRCTDSEGVAWTRGEGWFGHPQPKVVQYTSVGFSEPAHAIAFTEVYEGEVYHVAFVVSASDNPKNSSEKGCGNVFIVRDHPRDKTPPEETSTPPQTPPTGPPPEIPIVKKPFSERISMAVVTEQNVFTEGDADLGLGPVNTDNRVAALQFILEPDWSRMFDITPIVGIGVIQTKNGSGPYARVDPDFRFYNRLHVNPALQVNEAGGQTTQTFDTKVTYIGKHIGAEVSHVVVTEKGDNVVDPDSTVKRVRIWDQVNKTFGPLFLGSDWRVNLGLGARSEEHEFPDGRYAETTTYKYPEVFISVYKPIWKKRTFSPYTGKTKTQAEAYIWVEVNSAQLRTRVWNPEGDLTWDATGPSINGTFRLGVKFNSLFGEEGLFKLRN